MYIIETNNLCKSYGKSRGIIDLNLKIKEGEIFGFVGPNGAGKSTTIRTLLNFIFPTSGSAKILGKDIVKESSEIKKYIGYVPSEVKFYDEVKVKDIFVSENHKTGEPVLVFMFDRESTRKAYDLWCKGELK